MFAWLLYLNHSLNLKISIASVLYRVCPRYDCFVSINFRNQSPSHFLAIRIPVLSIFCGATLFDPLATVEE